MSDAREATIRTFATAPCLRRAGGEAKGEHRE
jgi:hypothetical protein